MILQCCSSLFQIQIGVCGLCLHTQISLNCLYDIPVYLLDLRCPFAERGSGTVCGAQDVGAVLVCNAGTPFPSFIYQGMPTFLSQFHQPLCKRSHLSSLRSLLPRLFGCTHMSAQCHPDVIFLVAAQHGADVCMGPPSAVPAPPKQQDSLGDPFPV